MSAASGVKLTGVSALALKLATVFSSIEAKVNAEIAITALLIETEAKRRCAVDTGRLRSSIHTERDGRLGLRVLTNVEYAAFVEFGTRRQAAQPFLFPAAESHRLRFIANLKAILRL